MKRFILHMAIAAFVVTVSSCSTFAADEAKGKGVHERVSVEQFEKLWKQDKLRVLDVRRDVEYEDGHIPGALNLDYYSKDFKELVGKLDKSKPWLVHCRSGGRSAGACKIMAELGFIKVYDLAPGMNGWEKAGKEVETGPTKADK
jgi:rhodanese-related sulfurtransferase